MRAKDVDILYDLHEDVNGYPLGVDKNIHIGG